MSFCGQCGLQLTPGMTKCPRCGTLVEGNPVVDVPGNPDAPTIASPSMLGRNQAGPGTPPANPQPLVLRPGQEGNYTTQAANSPTTKANVPNYTPSNPGINTSYPGQMPDGNYPTQAAYPDYRTQGGGGYAPGSTPPPSGAGYQAYPTQYQDRRTAYNSKGRNTGLVIILIGLLLIISAVALFILQHNGAISSNGGAGNGSGGTPVISPGQQAQQVIQQYYNDVNAQRYQDAYSLWLTYPQSLATFSNGYKNTQNDTVSFDSPPITQQDGTVKVTVTVVATEKIASGSKQTTYKGYYLVGPQSDGTWKILKGQLQQA